MLAGTRRRSGKTETETEAEAEKAEAETEAEAEKAEAEQETVARLPAMTTTPPVVAWAPIRAANDLLRVRDMP